MDYDKPDLVLYIEKGCPYCLRVTDFLKENKLSIPIKEIWHDEANQKEYKDLTFNKIERRVPLLSVDGEPMIESLDIIEKLKDIYQINK
ncbi:MAG: glutathione S-transferase N-terminal domain-containing protein [archaeon]